MYAGPFDAIKKIYGQHGIAGIYKGQAVTLLREAAGYGIYFWAYEKLMQREMAKKGIRRDQVNPANAVLYGAAAGYAVRASVFFLLDHMLRRLSTTTALGDHIPHRHDQVSYADRWFLGSRRAKIQVHPGLCAHSVADRRPSRLHAGTGPDSHQVRLPSCSQ